MRDSAARPPQRPWQCRSLRLGAAILAGHLAGQTRRERTIPWAQPNFCKQKGVDPACRVQRTARTMSSGGADKEGSEKAAGLATEAARDTGKSEKAGPAAPEGSPASKKLPYHGLVNHGNTCFLNSVVQALFHTAPLRRWVLSDAAREAVESSGASRELAALFARMAASRHGAHPTVPLQLGFGWTAADMGYQHDINEMLHALVNALDAVELRHAGADAEGVTTSGDRVVSHAKRVFGGRFVHTMECKVCHSRRERAEPFLDVAVSVAGGDATSLEAALLDLTGETEVEVDCEPCGVKRPHSKRCIVPQPSDDATGLPPVLAVTVLRYAWNFETGQRRKVSTPLSSPLELDGGLLTGDTNSFNLDEPESRGSIREDLAYELFGLIVHEGTAESGHYYSFVKVAAEPGDPEADDHGERWVRAEDTTVVGIDLMREMPDVKYEPGELEAKEAAEAADAKKTPGVTAALVEMFDEGDAEEKTASNSEGAQGEGKDASTKKKTALTAEEIDALVARARPHRVSGVRPSGSTAYMMFYRRRATPWNAAGEAPHVGGGGPAGAGISGFDVPASVAEQLVEEDAVRTAEEEKAAERAARLVLTVNFNTGDVKELREGENSGRRNKNVTIDRRNSCTHVLRQVLVELGASESLIARVPDSPESSIGAELDRQIRFRLYDTATDFLGPVISATASSFGAAVAEAEGQLTRLFIRQPRTSITDRSAVSLLLEVAAPDAGELEAFDTTVRRLRVRMLKPPTAASSGGAAGGAGSAAAAYQQGEMLAEPVEVVLPPDVTCSQLIYAAASAALGDADRAVGWGGVVCTAKGQVLYAPGGDGAASSTEDATKVSELRGTRDGDCKVFGDDLQASVMQGDVVIVALLADFVGDAPVVSAATVLTAVAAAEEGATEQADTIELRFNTPGSKKFKHSVMIHKRKPLRLLLELAAAELEMHPREIALDVKALRLGKRKLPKDLIGAADPKSLPVDVVLALPLRDVGIDKNGAAVKLVTAAEAAAAAAGNAPAAPSAAEISVLPFCITATAQCHEAVAPSEGDTSLLPLSVASVPGTTTIRDLKLRVATEAGWDSVAADCIRVRVVRFGRLGTVLPADAVLDTVAKKHGSAPAKGKRGGSKGKGKDKGKGGPGQREVHPAAAGVQDKRRVEVVIQRTSAPEYPSDSTVLVGLMRFPPADHGSVTPQAPAATTASAVESVDDAVVGLGGLGFDEDDEDSGGPAGKEGDTVACSACTFENHWPATTCEICGGSLPPYPVRAAAQTEPDSVAAAAAAAPEVHEAPSSTEAGGGGGGGAASAGDAAPDSASSAINTRFEVLLDGNATVAETLVRLAQLLDIDIANACISKASRSGAMSWVGGGGAVAAGDAVPASSSAAGGAEGSNSAIVLQAPQRGDIEDLECRLNSGRWKLRDGETLLVSDALALTEWERNSDDTFAIGALLGAAGDAAQEVHVGIRITI